MSRPPPRSSSRAQKFPSPNTAIAPRRANAAARTFWRNSASIRRSETAMAEKCLNEIGICFMFAPKFHSLSPILGKVRREIGKPTIFNRLGPLCNPANAPHQIIGVYRKDLVEKNRRSFSRARNEKIVDRSRLGRFGRNYFERRNFRRGNCRRQSQSI